MKIKPFLLSALLLLACDPAQEISTNAMLDTCSDTSEKHAICRGSEGSSRDANA